MEDDDLPPEVIQELKADRNPADKYLCGVCTENARTLEELHWHTTTTTAIQHVLSVECHRKRLGGYELHVKRCKEDFDPIKLQKKNESECPICRKVE